jgi:hypothetical protein
LWVLRLQRGRGNILGNTARPFLTVPCRRYAFPAIALLCIRLEAPVNLRHHRDIILPYQPLAATDCRLPADKLEEAIRHLVERGVPVPPSSRLPQPVKLLSVVAHQGAYPGDAAELLPIANAIKAAFESESFLEWLWRQLSSMISNLISPNKKGFQRVAAFAKICLLLGLAFIFSPIYLPGAGPDVPQALPDSTPSPDSTP